MTLGGLLLPSFLASSAFAKSPLKPTTGKSVIFLFQQGGPSQFETFDPKVDAPDGVRTIGGTVATSVTGLHFAEPLKELAPWAHRLAVVRSFQTGTNHGFLRPLVSQTLHKASIGAFYNRVAGTNHPQTGLPRAVSLWPKAVDETTEGPRDKYGRFDHTGDLGLGYAPFTPGGAGPLQDNMKLQLAPDRLDDRRRLLGSLDALRRNVEIDEQYQALDGLRQQAVDVLLGCVAEAFDWQQEDARTIARYDTSAAYRPELWKTKSNRRHYDSHTKSLGKLLLLARRLCERGCGMVSINTEFVWDMHGNSGNLDIARGADAVTRPFAHAVSAFIEDCEARGLADKILLVACGEMGRTPKINTGGGRDHWPKVSSLMLYGGGLTSGQTIGATTRDGGEPTGTPLTPDHLLATIFHTLFDFTEARLVPGLPDAVLRNLTDLEKAPRVL